MTETLIFTISYNRNKFLGLSMASVLSQAKNSTYVIWDNADNPETKSLVDSCRITFPNESVRVVYEASENIGLNAASAIVEKYRSSKTRYIMSVDEDILMLPLGFQTSLQTALSPTIGYVALDVFQDKTTNGAKPPMDHYSPIQIGSYVLLEGPTGGWASMSSVEAYDKAGGYPVREEKFFGLDGLFSESVRRAGMKTGILQGECCYHATGDLWNKGFNFGSVLTEKMENYQRWIMKGSP